MLWGHDGGKEKMIERSEGFHQAWHIYASHIYAFGIRDVQPSQLLDSTVECITISLSRIVSDLYEHSLFWPIHWNLTDLASPGIYGKSKHPLQDEERR